MGGNFKVRCLDNNRNFLDYTVGKVYEVKNGSLINDSGIQIPRLSNPVNSFEEWQEFSAAKWELVTDKQSHPIISIKRNGNRVTAIMYKDGKFAYSAGANMKKFDMDYNKAVKAVVDKLLEKASKAETPSVDSNAIRIIKQDKYEVGDKVKVREDLRPRSYGDNSVVNEMLPLKGKIVTIRVIETHQNGYRIEEDDWEWTPEMFEGKVFEGVSMKSVVQEVKRQAEPGEWIKIVSPIYNGLVSGDDYRKGDILKVKERKCRETLTAEGLDGKPINDREYVVLEGYVPEDKPTVKEVKRPAKVGEWIEIVKPVGLDNRYYLIGDICEVKKSFDNGVYATTRHTHPCNIGECTSFIYHEEYIVLENYQPEVATEPTEPELPKETPYEFKVGDRVELVNQHDGAGKGEKGTVIGFCPSGENNVTVEFDNHVNGHSGGLSGCIGKAGYCYHCKPDELKLITEEPQSTLSTIDWEQFKSGKIAVHCDTKEKAKAFLKECDEQGIKWQCDEKASSDTKYIYGKYTCYSNYCMDKGRIGFSDIDYFKSKGIEVIDYISKMQPTDEYQPEVDIQPSPNPLVDIPTEELLEEIKRRTK